MIYKQLFPFLKWLWTKKCLFSSNLRYFFKCPSVKIFSKLIWFKISNRLQLLLYGRIRRDKPFFIINSFLIIIIYMDKKLSFKIKRIAVFASSVRRILNSNLVRFYAQNWVQVKNKGLRPSLCVLKALLPNLQRRGACRNIAYYSMLIILSLGPKGGAWPQCPPPKYAPGFRAAKPLAIRTAIHAENWLVFRVVWVRALYKRAFKCTLTKKTSPYLWLQACN